VFFLPFVLGASVREELIWELRVIWSC